MLTSHGLCCLPICSLGPVPLSRAQPAPLDRAALPASLGTDTHTEALHKTQVSLCPPLPDTPPKLPTHSERLPESPPWSHITSLTSSSTSLPLPPSPPATLSSLFFEHAVLCTGIFLWTMHFCQKYSSPAIYRAPNFTSVGFTQMIQIIFFQSGFLSINILSKTVDSSQTFWPPSELYFFFSLSTYHIGHFMYFAYLLSGPFPPSSKLRSPKGRVFFLFYFGYCYIPNIENSSWYIIGI